MHQPLFDVERFPRPPAPNYYHGIDFPVHICKRSSLAQWEAGRILYGKLMSTRKAKSKVPEWGAKKKNKKPRRIFPATIDRFHKKIEEGDQPRLVARPRQF
jgi:hypothetical protein